MGIGFTWVLVVLSAMREFFGMGSIFGIEILGSWYQPMVIMILPAGAFISLGILVGIMNAIKRRGN